MVDTVDMVDMDIMERDLLKLMLSRDTSEDMAVMVIAVDMAMEAMDMDVDTMERGMLKLKLMLSQDTSEDMVVMVTAVDMVTEAMVTVVDMVVMEVTDIDVDTMERGMLKLSPDILEDMVVMVVDMDMVVTDMVDMIIAVEFLLKFSSLPKDTIHIVLF